MRVLSTLALAGVVRALAPGFERDWGVRIEAEFLPTAVLMPRLRGGEYADLVLLTDKGLGALIAEGVVRGESRVALARSFVGMAVRAGAVRPDISTVAGFRAALVSAGSIALSRQGASGVFLAGLWERMGLAAVVAGKAVVIESGFTAELVASGRVELALQQVSELVVVPGIEVVGRIPAVLGGDGVFSGGVLVGAGEAGVAEGLLAAIAGAGGLLVEKGLEPAGPG